MVKEETKQDRKLGKSLVCKERLMMVVEGGEKRGRGNKRMSTFIRGDPCGRRLSAAGTFIYERLGRTIIGPVGKGGDSRCLSLRAGSSGRWSSAPRRSE